MYVCIYINKLHMCIRTSQTRDFSLPKYYDRIQQRSKENFLRTEYPCVSGSSFSLSIATALFLLLDWATVRQRTLRGHWKKFAFFPLAPGVLLGRPWRPRRLRRATPRPLSFASWSLPSFPRSSPARAFSSRSPLLLLLASIHPCRHACHPAQPPHVAAGHQASSHVL